MIVLGIDSAELTGIAVVARLPGQRETLVRRATIPVRSAVDVGAAVAELASAAPDLVAIEAPFVRLNPATGLALATLLGRWLQEWERRGVRTTTVLASTWQSALLTGLIDRRSDRATRKAAAQRWARATFGVELPEDEADAAGIASWAIRRALGRRAA